METPNEAYGVLVTLDGEEIQRAMIYLEGTQAKRKTEIGIVWGGKTYRFTRNELKELLENTDNGTHI